MTRDIRDNQKVLLLLESLTIMQREIKEVLKKKKKKKNERTTLRVKLPKPLSGPSFYYVKFLNPFMK